jgi:hypothetical protein
MPATQCRNVKVAIVVLKLDASPGIPCRAPVEQMPIPHKLIQLVGKNSLVKSATPWRTVKVATVMECADPTTLHPVSGSRAVAVMFVVILEQVNCALME